MHSIVRCARLGVLAAGVLLTAAARADDLLSLYRQALEWAQGLFVLLS